MKTKIFGLILSLIVILFLTGNVYAAVTAASCSFSDVQNAVNSASNGATINVPAGTCTWSSTLTLTKSIALIGAGVNSTIINNNAGTLIRWQTTAASVPLRLSGIRINSSDSQSYMVIINGAASAVRVDHCYFYKGDTPLVFNEGYAGGSAATGPINGLVDHCTFQDASRSMFVTDHQASDSSYPSVGGSGNYYGAAEWNLPLKPGTTNMIVVENCLFQIDSGFTSTVSDTTQIYGTGGGVRAFRYNTFTGAAHYIDAHGDDPDYSVEFYEVYNNTFNYGPYKEQDDLANIRGGQAIYHDNNFVGYPAGSTMLDLVHYWPTDVHLVSNTYWWNNTLNGAAADQASMMYVKDVPTCSGCSTATIHQDQQYFLHAPQPGNTFYPYTPLAYPHPFITDCTTYPALCDAGSTTTPIYGDVNGDGQVTIYDAALVAQYAVGLITLTPAQIKLAGVSGDASPSTYDAALIAQYAVGLINKFPVQQ